MPIKSHTHIQQKKCGEKSKTSKKEMRERKNNITNEDEQKRHHLRNGCNEKEIIYRMCLCNIIYRKCTLLLYREFRIKFLRVYMYKLINVDLF